MGANSSPLTLFENIYYEDTTNNQTSGIVINTIKLIYSLSSFLFIFVAFLFYNYYRWPKPIADKHAFIFRNNHVWN